MNPLAWIKSAPWKIGTITAALALVGVSIALLVARIDNARLIASNNRFDQRINDPKTGYVVRLAQSQTNTAQCQTTVADQSRQIEAQSALGAAALAESQMRYNAEYKNRLAAEREVGSLLARKPRGDTLEARVLDVDAQILGDLK